MPRLTPTLDAGGVALPYDLQVPSHCKGTVVFVHGSGSSRLSPRNRQVASGLRDAGFATLLFDLLTEDEGDDRSLVFDTTLLAGRLVHVLRWLRAHQQLGNLPIGLFGASTGAAAALMAARQVPVDAVVSRGGRPDLAAVDLPHVTAPTLLIVGGDDDVVLDLNQRAAAMLRCEHALEVIPGATHLFEEPGALAAVVALAVRWFEGHLTVG